MGINNKCRRSGNRGVAMTYGAKSAFRLDDPPVLADMDFLMILAILWDRMARFGSDGFNNFGVWSSLCLLCMGVMDVLSE